MDKSEQILEILSKMDNKVDNLFNRIDGLDTRVENGFKDVHSEITEVNAKMDDGFKEVYSTMQEEFNHVYAEFKDIQMTLENETNKNIQLIAEGHFDLKRKLDDALRVENEKELMLIKLTKLENDVRRLKARVEETA